MWGECRLHVRAGCTYFTSYRGALHAPHRRESGRQQAPTRRKPGPTGVLEWHFLYGNIRKGNGSRGHYARWVKWLWACRLCLLNIYVGSSGCIAALHDANVPALVVNFICRHPSIPAPRENTVVAGQPLRKLQFHTPRSTVAA